MSWIHQAFSHEISLSFKGWEDLWPSRHCWTTIPIISDHWLSCMGLMGVKVQQDLNHHWFFSFNSCLPFISLNLCLYTKTGIVSLLNLKNKTGNRTRSWIIKEKFITNGEECRTYNQEVFAFTKRTEATCKNLSRSLPLPRDRLGRQRRGKKPRRITERRMECSD